MTVSHWYGRSIYADELKTKEEQQEFINRCGKDYLNETKKQIKRMGLDKWKESFECEDNSGDMKCWQTFKEQILEKGDSLLDVGSNVGHHCFRMKHEGYNPSGLEPSVDMANYCFDLKQQLGKPYNEIVFYNYMVEDIKLIDDINVEWIFSKHVFEHVTNPVQTLKDWKEIARKGICGIVPDKEPIKIKKGNGQHLWRFSAKVITKLLEECGYKNIGTCSFYEEADNQSKLGFWGFC